MESAQLHDVVIDAFRPGADAVAGLMRVFGIDAAIAQSIVQRVPVVVKRSVTLDAARPFEDALRAIGAQVRLQPVAGVESRRPAALVETSLMHGGGWRSDAPIQQQPRTSLPAPSTARSDAPLIPLAKTFEFMDQVSPAPPPKAIDPRARTTRFAEDLMLPWVGSSPEPPRGDR